ncbi:MAG: hypothetical protein FJY55_10310 [Betaproteobacteria bacterium]|nr:hypothetical protein [Betaproteobacteria bacterium]
MTNNTVPAASNCQTPKNPDGNATAYVAYVSVLSLRVGATSCEAMLGPPPQSPLPLPASPGNTILLGFDPQLRDRLLLIEDQRGPASCTSSRTCHRACLVQAPVRATFAKRSCKEPCSCSATCCCSLCALARFALEQRRCIIVRLQGISHSPEGPHATLTDVELLSDR